MAICMELTGSERVLVSGPAVITLQESSPGRRVRLRISAEKDVIIVKEKIPV